MRVLFIEDNELLGESVEEFLVTHGIEVKWLKDERALEFEDLNLYDVVVLDLMLRYYRGEDLLLDIKRRKPDLPVLILTAKQRIEDKELCFNRGADDYLTKPFEPKELLLRLKVLARRRTRGEVERIGDLEIDLARGVIKRGNEEIKVSKTAWELLTFLLRHRGEILPKERIISYVWKGKDVGEDVLRAYIKELRKILPPGAIKTYKGRGYQLVE
ncbi:response regulator transcription factor [Thermovibrio ammonificans]|jgi:DNA-binding response OmpR family regulator|uniref:Two component transcriptional regulator, winged helix family n=1 Tax=Thermovibrio ammonificans (strain DSM 15698 / JCM 12110 / HB-1) TaxID=648996 RepID=E8T2L9_THEA1|nr:response regulator transcription factor [Thermovibrio ammonificans]ADU97114.1 two component transcriptional regulator, winged helix family [Thermovibrio ammonificans HB-1]